MVIKVADIYNKNNIGITYYFTHAIKSHITDDAAGDIVAIVYSRIMKTSFIRK